MKLSYTIPIVLNSSNYHYVALQEIGIDLNSGNIKISNQKPGIIYFEWDTNFNDNVKVGDDLETLRETFIKTYEKTKTHFLLTTQIVLVSIQIRVILKIKFIP